MNDIGSILIIAIVFRLLLLVLKAWWGGERKNDYRRDR